MSSDNIKINECVYFLHIPKTSGSSLKSKQIIKLGHNFNVKNIYRTPADKKGFLGFKHVIGIFINIPKLQIQKSAL